MNPPTWKKQIDEILEDSPPEELDEIMDWVFGDYEVKTDEEEDDDHE